jgi:hypothetical protein
MDILWIFYGYFMDIIYPIPTNPLCRQRVAVPCYPPIGMRWGRHLSRGVPLVTLHYPFDSYFPAKFELTVGTDGMEMKKWQDS